MKEVTFELEEVEYKLPNKITIDNYVKIFKIKELFSDQYFAAKLINILSGAPMDRLLESNFQTIEYLANYGMSLFPQGKQKFEDRFELNGVHYGFLPSWKELSFAEYVDLDTLMGKKGDDLLNYIHIMMAIMYRPIIGDPKAPIFKIEKYDVTSMKERAELFKTQLDVRFFIGAQFFFTKFAKKYSEHSHQSLTTMTTWEKMKFVWKNRKMISILLSKKGSGGTLSSTELLQMTLPNTTKSWKSRWLQFLINLPTSLRRTERLRTKEKR
jgi:hypothetical protein